MIDITLRKGMSRTEVNDIIINYIELVSDIYAGNNVSHIWKCKCGEIIKNRRWSDIIKRNNVKCDSCIRREKYKDKVESTGEYKYIKTFKTGEVLPNDKIAKVPHIQVEHIYCGNVYVVQAGQFINKGKRCGKCCQKYENSFAYHIEVELGLKLEDVWDFEKNTVNPYHIWKSSSKQIWIKCKNDETNELNRLMKKSYHTSSLVTCNNFIGSSKCSYCNSNKVHPYDSFGYHNFDKVLSWHPDNKISPFRVSVYSGKSYKFICENCNHIWESMLSNIAKGKWCPICSKSKGEKKISLHLNYLNIKYIHDEPYFKDLLSDKGNPLRPDFILPEHKIWIEYDGEFHYKDINKNETYKLQLINDKRKNEYAKKHGWKLIRIPYWEFDNIEKILEKEITYYTRINFND